MSIPRVTTIKQVIVIGGTIAFIVWIAYELNKRYPLFPKKEQSSSSSSETGIGFN